MTKSVKIVENLSYKRRLMGFFYHAAGALEEPKLAQLDREQ